IFNPKARNRIMLGMSRIVVVIEGAERSGTLATARLAYHLKIPILVLDKSEINGPTGYLADWARSHQDPMVQTFSMADQVLDKYGVS
ncbi:MAG: DNA-processing protein DprA, partial [Candidatus Dojkabacteria bacterium]